MLNGLDTSTFYFVSFIDLLGFSSMVKSDLEAPAGREKYINKLYKVHKQTLELNATKFEMDLLQFSDSVVLATKFVKGNFGEFLKIISKYQYDLFCEGILARGGIAYGRHFNKSGFMYSLGLIEAYEIEKSIARFPRIIVSHDLCELIFPDGKYNEDIPLIKEQDNLIFIDYFAYGNEEETGRHLEMLVASNKSTKPSIKEKYIWLADYFSFKFPDHRPKMERFSTLPVE